MICEKKIVLASSSLSRYRILKNINLMFEKITPNCDENKIKKQLIKKKVKIKKISFVLAKQKALSVSVKKKDKIVVGADTVIEFKGTLIEKAKNKKEALKKLLQLSNKTHKIYSSAVIVINKQVVWKTTQQSSVKIRKLNKSQIKKYLDKSDKNILKSVGCYQIEKGGATIIERIKGDFFNVMGFPLFPFLKFMIKYNKQIRNEKI